MSRSYLLIFLFVISGYVTKAQQVFSTYKYPLVDFRMPLDISPPALAGSFGELRPNHFHSGIDFRTNQREGYPVYAVADGYVSRIRVQNSGFGQALYLNHPNGYTTVYGHLQRFNPKIAKIAKDLEYSKRSFEIDEFPAAELIPVHKGEIIAYSGNRGSSGGPHLHFEIRDTKTEATINPQLFGINIPDNIPPVVYSMYVYHLNGKVFNEFTPKQYYQVSGAAGNYRLTTGTLALSGEVGFGIITTDRHNGLSGLNGVYSVELQVDGKSIFTSSLERFQFENSKAINSHIDYPTFINTRKSIQKSFVDPGNPLQIYSGLQNRGRISFNDGQLHELKYIITDSKGNQSILPFKVKAGLEPSTAPAADTERDVTVQTILYPYNQVNEYNDESIKVIFPKGTLYNDLTFKHKTISKPSRNAYSNVYQLQNAYTPLHTGFELWIKADASLEPYQSKAIIVNTNGSSQGGSFDEGYVKANIRSFGGFYIAIDTIPPAIFPLNISNGKNMSGVARMNFKIRDNLSGIKSFNGYIDGQWVLMEFDTKTATLWHTFDEKTTTGKHEFSLTVIDMKENSKTYTISFYK
jgi:murein DD-endopeptidase MepM/ murein hydrolase activator NlpD